MNREPPRPGISGADTAGRPRTVRQAAAPDTAGLLGRTALFGGLDPETLARIAAGTAMVRIGRGDPLFRAGDACAGFHLVVEGRIKLSLHSAQGTERVVELPGPGQTFGEAAMFLRIPYRVSAEAVADSRLLHVSATPVFSELERDSQLAHRIIAGLSMRLHRLVGEIEAQSLMSGTRRVVGYLLSLADPAAAAETVVHLPALKNVIASRLNLTHEHFSRILHGLAAAGVIRLNGPDIRIPDLDALRRHPG
ncbi:MAG: Crp/Fnr family transcriptional regulator [Burkholderiales bacterium]|nr:Crp/Fnr family transcriptional regulator [Burkholderiales bacterium]